MCGETKVTRKYKECLEGKQHVKVTYEYPFDERRDDPYAGTSKCSNITPSQKMIIGSTPINASCPECAFERAQQQPSVNQP
jgi:hypothetical protein